MQNKILLNIAGPFEKLGVPHVEVFRPLINAFEKQKLKKEKLPRYVQVRKLKSLTKIFFSFSFLISDRWLLTFTVAR